MLRPAERRTDECTATTGGNQLYAIGITAPTAHPGTENIARANRTAAHTPDATQHARSAQQFSTHTANLRGSQQGPP